MMRIKNITGLFTLALLWAGFFLAISLAYWVGIHEAQASPDAPLKTHHLTLQLLRWKTDLYLNVGQLGLAVIFILMFLLLVAVVLAAVAQRRRREVEAANRKLLEEIGERERAQEEVVLLNASLEQRVAARTLELETANKELDAFCSSVSHDLRAPLRAIDGFSDALLKDYHDKLDEQGQRYLDRVRSASQRMAQLIDDLLSLSRVARTEMRRQDINLTALAWEVVAGLRQLDPERNVELIVAEGLTARGDPRLIRQVLENLLGNAWKYTSKAFAARIEMGTCEGRNGGPAYFVKDDGAGFDMAYVGKLFGVFQRLHSSVDFPGTGVGLATVQRIIHRHGGEVWAQGAVGQGATFYFTL
jgi:light-regulated signal transduction histidine kinase (bacteriophytochrome)